MITKIEGIILNEMAYGESSKIINVITKDKGIIGIMCKGAKSMKSSLRALTMPLTHAYFYIYYKEDKLSILKDVDLINSFNIIKQDILLIAYANYLTELTTQVAKQDYDEALYELYISALEKINGKLDP
jgi:DNA repair protein RecO (recombination protein O)